MDEIEIQTQVQKCIEDEFFKLRAEYADKLREVVGPPPKISPEEAAALLGVSYSTVYRWCALPWSRRYAPQIDQVPDIAAFLGRGWAPFGTPGLTSWPGGGWMRTKT